MILKSFVRRLQLRFRLVVAYLGERLALSFKRPVANPHFMFEIRDNQDFHNELTCFVTASKEHLLNWALAVIKDYPPLAEVAEKEEVRKIDITPDNSTLIAKSLIYGKNPFVAVAAKMFE